jgi:DNA mismatch repair ATPase MutS
LGVRVVAFPGVTKDVSLRITPEGSSTGDIFATLLEYVSLYFLHEVRTFHAAMAEVVEHRDDLRTLFRLMGELDAWQSVAAYRAGIDGFVEPVVDEQGPLLDVQDACHPLLDNAVPNSVAIASGGIAITGSNMSGKSSFLRTVGVNALLAQTIYTCLAAGYRARPLRIISSMNESDDLLGGKSYYLAEAERLLTIVREAERDSDPLLALIDEPLAGTNSPERLAASREILRHLAVRNVLVLVSTHDVELVAQLRGRTRTSLITSPTRRMTTASTSTTASAQASTTTATR